VGKEAVTLAPWNRARVLERRNVVIDKVMELHNGATNIVIVIISAVNNHRISDILLGLT
jgi:hypothetical protein